MKVILFYVCPSVCSNCDGVIACLFRKGVGSAELRHCPCAEIKTCKNTDALFTIAHNHNCQGGSNAITQLARGQNH